MNINKLGKKSLSILLIFSALFFSSCDDYLEQDDPEGVLVDNYYLTEDDFERGLRGMYEAWVDYGGLYGNAGGAGGLVSAGDVMGDNLVLNAGSGRRSGEIIHNWLYNSGNAPLSLYTGSYQVAARANLILSKLGNLPAGTFKDKVEAEARAMRGIAMFEVARHFSMIPTQSSGANSSIGIVYPEVYDPFAKPARLATVQETYAKIMADLEHNVNALPSSAVGRLTVNGVKGMISKVALYMGDYPKAITVGNEVITAVAPCDKSLLSLLYQSAINNGVLIEFVITQQDDVLLDNNFSQGIGVSAVIEYSVDKDFRALFDDATEPERIATWFDEWQNSYVVRKWVYGVVQQGLNNGKYLRVEEVILNVAEAQFISGSGDPLTTLNMLRDARYSSYTGGETGTAVFDAIMLERRKELCFENGDRFFTLKRLQGVAGIPSTYTSGIQRTGNGYLTDGSGAAPAELVLPAGSHKWQLPINQDVINFNENIQQNANY